MQLHVYSNDRFLMLMHVIGKFPFSYIYDISKQEQGVCTTTSGKILAGHGTQFIQVHASGLTINPRSGHQCLLLAIAIEDILVDSSCWCLICVCDSKNCSQAHNFLDWIAGSKVIASYTKVAIANTPIQLMQCY